MCSHWKPTANIARGPPRQTLRASGCQTINARCHKKYFEGGARACSPTIIIESAGSGPPVRWDLSAYGYWGGYVGFLWRPRRTMRASMRGRLCARQNIRLISDLQGRMSYAAKTQLRGIRRGGSCDLRRGYLGRCVRRAVALVRLVFSAL